MPQTLLRMLLQRYILTYIGSYCKDCNCEGCNNTDEYEEVRAKAID